MTGVSGVFGIQEKPSIHLTRPSANSSISLGNATTIACTNIGAASCSEVFLSIQDAESNVEIASFGSVLNTGQFVWVPSSTLPLGPKCVVLKYSPPTRAGNVTLPRPVFHVEPSNSSSLAILSPSLDDMLEVGKMTRIVWTSPATRVHVSLYLLRSSFRQLIHHGLDENFFDWTVDAAVSAGFVVEIDGETSDVFFIAAPEPFVRIVSLLNGQDGALWARGQNATVVVESSDPSDTLRLEIRDQQGTLIFVVVEDAPASGVIETPVPFSVPPPEFSSCFMTAISNTYPGVHSTFPTPFSIVSQSHNDLMSSIASSLMLLGPVESAALIPGSHVNITWVGVLISSVAIVLFDMASGEEGVVGNVTNTGVFEWTVPLVCGEYALSLVGDGRLRTPRVRVRVVKGEGISQLTMTSDLPSVISVGDLVRVNYESSGDIGALVVELYNKAGFLMRITDNAPTNGSFSFNLENVTVFDSPSF